MHRAAGLRAFSVTSVATAATLAAAAGFTAPASAAPAPVAGTTCTTLAVGGVCHFDYGDYPSGATLSVPGSLSTLTVIVTGASGGSTSTTGPGGAGAVVLGEIPVPAGGGQLSIALGQPGQGSSGGSGYNSGGSGGSANAEYWNGAGGGGSSAVSWVGALGTQVVAGGGGGGGGDVSDWQGVNTPGFGGVGGAAGDPGGNGGDGGAPDAQNGSGGEYQSNSNGGGQPGVSAAGLQETSGGGGGGGGFTSGGSGGAVGGIGQCSIHGGCPPDAAPGAGGGGGGGSSGLASDARNLIAPVYATAPGASGSVTVFASPAQEYPCNNTLGAYVSVPKGVTGYGFALLGGAGSQGSNRTDSEGHGGAVTGVFSVTGGGQMPYTTGCDAAEGGIGVGVGGGQGGASLGDDKDGGAGGGASALSDPELHVLAAAGAGGGSGGNADCLGRCLYLGGDAGNGGGVNGTSARYDGEGGGGIGGLGGGDGGCGGCAVATNGTPGGHSDVGGGGGGGGSGYPLGGQGGYGGDLGAAGGAGGAGDSYENPVLSYATVGTNTEYGDGALYLVPITTAAPIQPAALSRTMPRANGRYRIQVAVTGDDAKSHRTTPFVFDQTCTLNGARLSPAAGKPLATVVYLKSGASATSPALPVGALCTIRAVETGHATRVLPATRQIVIAAGTRPLSFSFGYDTAKVIATNVSTGRSASFVDVVTCSYGDARSGLVHLREGGAFTAPRGYARRVFLVPVGAQCRIDQVRSPSARTRIATVGGTRWLTVSANGANQLTIVDRLKVRATNPVRS